MARPSYSSKKRLLFVLGLVMFISTFLIGRLGYLQIVKGEELKKGALEQWTKGITIKSKRGIIYDRKGKKLAVSVSASTVWASPADIKDPDKTAKEVARILNLDEEQVYSKITKKIGTEKLKQWITREEAQELRKLKLSGIEIVDDNRRYYPYGNFASYVLGFTNIDNNGLEGIEQTYDKYLTGTPGKWVKTTDAASRQLPFDGEKIYEASDGLSVVLTIDEIIQHFAEKAAEEAARATQAKNVSVIVMEPQTGDILALTTKPDYDPNEPRVPLNEETKRQWDNLSQEELQKRWYDMWRNFAISDAYEPGSTFKIITAAAALEENVIKPETHFYCNGFVRDIKGAVLKCSRWYNPHGSLNFIEGMNTSCNVVFVDVGRKVGKERFLKYIKAFGFGEKTEIELNGEQAGIVPSNAENVKEINLATMSYGHGIAVTPLQLINAVSAVANGGNLMTPRLVKELIDDDGKVVESFPPEVKRKVISESTSKTMLELLENVVRDGTGTSAYIPGFRVGGKTGTAQKIIDGKYAPGKYIGSFVAVAPADDPKVAILVIVDEPVGQYYGGTVAAPVAKSVLEETLSYLEVAPKFTKDEKEMVSETVTVPDIIGKNIGEAGKILTDLELKYTTEYSDLTSESIIIDQFPLPKIQVQKGSIIDLYLNVESGEKIIMPDLTSKTKAEVIKILDDLNLNYELKGEGKVRSQTPAPGLQIPIDEKIEVEFGDT
ncbi:penicillin-binding transpeptidase domain-containing protein [Tissierella sp. MB52-C2]|uniref:penicillin-binding transpeptidase domain-containing protein n=1 Tax=Tissierella sp. MB52-C2 TaxID=3070999 RepID=UPI00280A791E|nr:penicillin-binding transpeptidase domain-containing protein [Tissierella sp. MB52-C2]WMM23361.1 penicillin-binding transpeptidase domain-containing protein [Tissierella sp. MB52-C2]